MGKTIESLQDTMGFDVVEIFDENKPFILAKSTVAEVAIDFTLPELAVLHIKHAVDLKVPIVVGTTGWYEKFNEVSDWVQTYSGTLFYATNFSIGVNLFFAVNKKLAQYMNEHPSYKVHIQEIHHTEKKDAPSGTALTLGEQTIREIDRLTKLQLVESQFQQIDIQTLPVVALREEHVPGTHEITYQNEIDYIKLTHVAHNRLGFAMGAVEAAKFTLNKVGIFTMSDLLNF